MEGLVWFDTWWGLEGAVGFGVPVGVEHTGEMGRLNLDRIEIGFPHDEVEVDLLLVGEILVLPKVPLRLGLHPSHAIGGGHLLCCLLSTIASANTVKNCANLVHRDVASGVHVP